MPKLLLTWAFTVRCISANVSRMLRKYSVFACSRSKENHWSASALVPRPPSLWWQGDRQLKQLARAKAMLVPVDLILLIPAVVLSCCPAARIGSEC